MVSMDQKTDSDTAHSVEQSLFTRTAARAVRYSARPLAFIMAVLIILVWIAVGSLMGYNDKWQLALSSGPTIITFLMVFLLQNAQSRDTRAMEVKLDEIIRALPNTHMKLLDIEELDDDALEELQNRYQKLAEEAKKRLSRGQQAEQEPDIDLDLDK